MSEPVLSARRDAMAWHEGETTLVDVFREHVGRTPDKVLYRFLVDGEVDGTLDEWTFAELDRRARAVAVELKNRGVDGRAVLVFPPGMDFVVAFFGCLYAGVIAVPAYPPDPSRLDRTLPRFQSVVQGAQARVAITTSAMVPLARGLQQLAPGLAGLDWMAVDTVTDAEADAWERPELDAQTIAFLQFTSGSTGDPKGVIIRHAHLLANEAMMRDRTNTDANTVTANWVPFYHDLGLIGGVLHASFVGGSSVLMSPMHFLQRPLRWLEAVSRWRADLSGAPNFAFDLCVRRAKPEQIADLDLSSWRVVVVGAEPVRAATLERFVTTFGPTGFRRSAFFPGYGLAECVLSTSGGPTDTDYNCVTLDPKALELNRIVPVPPDSGLTLVSNGLPLPGAEVAVVRPDTHEEAHPDEIGELWLKGGHLASGYWQREDATERTYGGVIAGQPDRGRWLRTGDLGFIRGGELYITGRIKDLIILRGRNHYPQDIELTAESSHPAIRPGGSAAFSVPDGDDERLIVVAEVDVRRGEPLDAAMALRGAIATHHDATVDEVVLVKPRSVPKTSSGKVQRRQCRQQFLDGGLADVARLEAATAGTVAADAPVVEIEPPGPGREGILHWLRALLARATGTPADRIDDSASLAAMGLDSRSLVELSSDVAEGIGHEVPPSLFYDHPTLDGVATHLQEERRRAMMEAVVARALAELGDDSHGVTAAEVDAIRERLTAALVGGEAATVEVRGPGRRNGPKLGQYTSRLLGMMRASLDGFCAIYLYDPTREAEGELSLYLSSDPERPSHAFSIDEGLTGAALRDRVAIRVDCLEDDARHRPDLEGVPGEGPHAALFVPVFTPDNRVVAVLQAARPANRPFQDTDQFVLGGLADAARPVLLQVVLEAQMERARALESRTLQFLDEVRDTGVIEGILRHLVDACIDMFDCAAATVFLHDPSTDELYGEIRLDPPEERMHVSFPADHGIAGTVFQTGQPAWIRDAYADERFNPEVDKQSGFRTIALDTVPIPGSGGTTLGVLQLVNRRTPTWTRTERDRLLQLAREAGRALENRELQGAMMTQEISLSALDAMDTSHGEPIAIVGMACRFPGGVDSPEALWDLVLEGVDAIEEVPAERWDIDAYYDPDPAALGKVSTRWGGWVRDVDLFDAGFFGISPREARSIDPQHRLVLEVAHEALERAGIPTDGLKGSRTGTYVGVSNTDYGGRLLYGRPVEQLDAYTITGSAFSVVTGRLSYVLGAEGPSVPVDTACSSSLVAVHLAVRALQKRECDLALAGGVNLMLTPAGTICFSRLQAMAPDGRCKTFDARADGYVRSEGCGMIALKRLSDARKARDPVIAVIRGSAVNHDGRSNGLTAPSGVAQRAVIEQALKDAGLAPSQVQYVEAHGTGTALGDPIELNALGAVFASNPKPLFVGSIKTNFGHTESAAGIAGLMKAALVAKHAVIPPHLHFETPTPHVSWDRLPLQVPTSAVAIGERAEPVVAGVSSFGIGGTNAHVILESPPKPPAPRQMGRAQPMIVAVSATHRAALAARARAVADTLSRGTSLRDVAYTLSRRRAHHPHRIAVVGTRRGKTADQLRLRADLPADPPPLRPDQPVFVFPGQGGQWPDMGRALLVEHQGFRETLTEIAAAMRAHLDVPLLDLFEGKLDSALWKRDDVVQPSLFAMQVALVETWRDLGVEPAAVLGHSMGEVAAAHVAGALSLTEACHVVALRSRLATEAPRGGGMMVADLDPDEAAALCAQHPDVLFVAAQNGPKLAVLAGKADVIGRIVDQREAKEQFARRVKVAYASHCPFMEPVRDALVAGLGDLAGSAPRLPWWSSVDAARRDVAPDADYWGENIRRAVRFWPAMVDLLDRGYDTFVEISPHPVLTGALEMGLTQAGRSASLFTTMRRDFGSLSDVLEQRALLYEAGHSGELPRIAGDFVDLPTYPWQKRRHWIELGDLASGQAPPDRGIEEEDDVDLGAISPDEAVKLELARLFGTSDPSAVDPHRTLSEQGFDSLMVLQLGARLASRHGLTLSAEIAARAMSMRVGELVGSLESGGADVADAQLGPVPLSLGQRWLVADRRGLDGRNLSVHLRAPDGLDAQAMARAVDAVIARHDVFRLRFDLDGDAPQVLGDTPPGRVWSFAEVSDLPAAIDAVDEEISVADGPLVRVAGFRGPDGDSWLVAVNHIVSDAYSVGVLALELAHAYRQVVSGAELELPPRSTPWSTWARGLAGWVGSDAVDASIPYWAAMASATEPFAPSDGDATYGAAEIRRFEGSEQVTGALRSAPDAEARVLAAVAGAVRSLGSTAQIPLKRVVHGRLPMGSGQDLSATVGFFATAHTLVVDADGGLDAAAAALAEVPDGGLSHTALLAREPITEELTAIHAVAQPQIRLNFIGDLDARFAALAPFSAGPDALGQRFDPARPREAELDVSVLIHGDRLRIWIEHSPGRLDAELVDRLGSEILAGLSGQRSAVSGQL